MRCTSADIERVNQILGHESVYPWIRDDSTPGELRYKLGEAYISNPNMYVISPNEWTAFVLIPRNGTMLEVHTAILPAGRGIRGVRAGRLAIRWIFEHSNYTKLISWIPVCNRRAPMYAKFCGFELEGLVKKSFLIDGRLYDQHLVGFEKE